QQPRSAAELHHEAGPRADRLEQREDSGRTGVGGEPQPEAVCPRQIGPVIGPGGAHPVILSEPRVWGGRRCYLARRTKPGEDRGAGMATGPTKKKVEMLQGVPLFSRTGQKELRQVAEACEIREVVAGKVLTTQDQHGREFFVVLSGVARCEVDGHEIRK